MLSYNELLTAATAKPLGRGRGDTTDEECGRAAVPFARQPLRLDRSPTGWAIAGNTGLEHQKLQGEMKQGVTLGLNPTQQ